MKKPQLSHLIARTSTNFTYDLPVMKSEMMLWIIKKLMLDIYKRLNTKASKRVINVFKRVPAFYVINNQMIVKNNGVAPIGKLRIYIVSSKFKRPAK